MPLVSLKFQYRSCLRRGHLQSSQALDAHAAAITFQEVQQLFQELCSELKPVVMSYHDGEDLCVVDSDETLAEAFRVFVLQGKTPKLLVYPLGENQTVGQALPSDQKTLDTLSLSSNSPLSSLTLPSPKQKQQTIITTSSQQTSVETEEVPVEVVVVETAPPVEEEEEEVGEKEEKTLAPSPQQGGQSNAQKLETLKEVFPCEDVKYLEALLIEEGLDVSSAMDRALAQTLDEAKDLELAKELADKELASMNELDIQLQNDERLAAELDESLKQGQQKHTFRNIIKRLKK